MVCIRVRIICTHAHTHSTNSLYVTHAWKFIRTKQLLQTLNHSQTYVIRCIKCIVIFVYLIAFFSFKVIVLPLKGRKNNQKENSRSIMEATVIHNHTHKNKSFSKYPKIFTICSCTTK